jgi:hypothetical protein
MELTPLHDKPQIAMFCAGVSFAEATSLEVPLSGQNCITASSRFKYHECRQWLVSRSRINLYLATHETHATLLLTTYPGRWVGEASELIFLLPQNVVSRGLLNNPAV